MKQLPPAVHAWLQMQSLPDRVEGPIEQAAIEPGAICNLRCPFCPTGNGTLALSKELLTLADFRATLDALGRGVRRLSLHSYGEGLLNPDIYDMIEETRARGIRSELSVNLSYSAEHFSRAHAERLVRSGLDLLMVSCGGVTQETYQLYRVGGDVERVLSNIRMLLDAKRRLSGAHPEILWLFHVHKQNQKEMPAARELAAELGIEVLFKPLVLPEAAKDEWAIPEEAQDSEPGTRLSIVPGQLCRTVWKMPTIHSDGSVLPCCAAFDRRYSLGNIRQESIGELWNKPLAVAMRRYLRTGAEPELKLPCRGCPYDPWAADR